MRLPDFTIYDLIAQTVFVLVKDDEGRVVYAFMNACGLGHLDCGLDDVVGRSADALFTGRAATSVKDRQARAWADGQSVTYEIAIPIGDNTLWVRTRLEPVFDEAGELAYMVGISQDISQERALQQMHAMTSAMAAEMEDFVSLAAHDLRSPIANVKTLADLVREDFVDMGDGKLEMIGMIEQISTRALELVSDVMSQAAAANAGSDRRDFDIKALCEDILVTLDPARLHVVTVPRARLNADYIAIQIILRNLIDNALKHSKTKRTELEISVRQHADERIEITVCDDGTGFADPALAFLDGGALGVDSGFGLLGIRRLVRARGGEISAVPPTSGRGAEVRFQLPGHVLAMDQKAGAVASPPSDQDVAVFRRASV